MGFEELFNQSYEKGTLEWLLAQLVDEQQVESMYVKHQNTGEKAFEAAKREIENYSQQGGVVHYQRNLAATTTNQFISTATLDLVWIEKNIGQVERIQSYLRGNEASRQLFITLRLSNRIIVEYSLNSLENLHSSFKFDFSSRGYNLEFDDQVQSPIVLNQHAITEKHYTSWVDKEDLTHLKSVWSKLSTSLKGDY